MRRFEEEAKKKDKDGHLKVVTDQTSSIRLGDDLSLSSPASVPKLKFGVLSAKTDATN